MTNQEAIDWLGLLKQRDIEFDDYSEDTKELREKAIGCFKEALNLGIQSLETQKIGYWVKYGSPRCGEQHYQCTSCGYYINFGQWGEVYTKEFKYCPNCCARIKGEKE